MRKQQVERELQRLHESWIEAIKSTPGIGEKRFRAIMKRREEIARGILNGRGNAIPRQ